MVEWATDVVEAIGLLGVALLVALESIFPPIPSELVLLLTGFNVSRSSFGPVEAVIAATVGSVVGALVLYAIGRWIHEDRMERFIAGIGRFVGFGRADVHKAFLWFHRHEGAAVFFGRLVPVVRSLVSLPAGADKMRLVPFVAYTAAGSALWNVLWIGIGWALGDRWEEAEQYTVVLDAIVVLGAVAFLVWALVRKRRERQAGAGSAAVTPSDPAGAP